MPPTAFRLPSSAVILAAKDTSTTIAGTTYVLTLLQQKLSGPMQISVVFPAPSVEVGPVSA